MTAINRIRNEYKNAVNKKQELIVRLRQTEKTEPTNFNQIWIIRDQIAYWEGRSEGLRFALDELER
jgi:hypothetical protein